MTFQQLSYLLEAYRAGSITQAAKNLYLTQSSISTAIGALEKELGFSVFRRNKNGIVPTSRGQRVIEQAGRIWESYRQMTEVTDVAPRLLRISAPSFEPFDEAFAALVEQTRGQGVVCRWEDAANAAIAAKKLAAMELDVSALLVHTPRVLAFESMFADKGLRWEKLSTVPVVIRIGPGHRLYNAQQIRPEELEEDLLLDGPTGTMVKNEFLKGVIRLREERTVFVRSAHSRNLMLSRGVGYAVGVAGPRRIDELFGFRCVPLGDVSYTVLIVTNPANKPEPEAARFIELVKEHL